MPVRPRKPVMRHSSQPAGLVDRALPPGARSGSRRLAAAPVHGPGPPARRAEPAHQALGDRPPRRRRRTRNGSTPMSSRRVTAPAASLVCSVLKTRWPVSAALDRDLGRLQVADFADHDDVRVLAQDMAQARGEGQADLGPHLDLVDAGHLVLDRVLDREDALVDGVDGVQPGVERGGLAGAGRPGDQHDAVGLVDQLLRAALVLVVVACPACPARCMPLGACSRRRLTLSP